MNICSKDIWLKILGQKNCLGRNTLFKEKSNKICGIKNSRSDNYLFITENHFCSKMILEKTNQNKTCIQWTPGSQVYLSKKKTFFGQK